MPTPPRPTDRAVPSEALACRACVQLGHRCLRCRGREARERVPLKRALRRAGVYVPAALRHNVNALRKLCAEHGLPYEADARAQEGE